MAYWMKLGFGNTARTATEIRQNMYVPIANPTANANLLTYYSMNTFIPNGTVFFDDSKERNTLTLLEEVR